MYELVVRTRISAAHFLREYDGPCGRLHGHTWEIEAAISGDELDERGMLVDFRKVKDSLGKILNELDHRHLNDLEPFKAGSGRNPTAENLARHIYVRLKPEMQAIGKNVKVRKVRVWESSDASAIYMEAE